MEQFEGVKKQYQDYILLFQVGDFYEIYGDDASKQIFRVLNVPHPLLHGPP